jgi:metallothiol transferase
MEIFMIKGLNHITFSVSDINVSIAFYQQVFDAVLLWREEGMAYFDLAGLWLALNLQTDIPRGEIRRSYTHLAFTVSIEDLPRLEERLQQLGVAIQPGRSRELGEGHSLYFTDPDGHLLEFHAGDRETRLSAYRQDIA